MKKIEHVQLFYIKMKEVFTLSFFVKYTIILIWSVIVYFSTKGRNYFGDSEITLDNGGVIVNLATALSALDLYRQCNEAAKSKCLTEETPSPFRGSSFNFGPRTYMQIWHLIIPVDWK